PVILDPVMKVEVVLPEEEMGVIKGDVTFRGGRVEGLEARGTAEVVRALVPLSETFGYATALRFNNKGRGTFSMTVDHYE
ncbi:elongation factor G, partial [Bacillus cereus]|nr:elongation factor G [Bacillus cereus]